MAVNLFTSCLGFLVLYAMYKTATPEKRKVAGSALFVMHMLGAGVATPTGHGFINLVIYGVLQGPKTHWWLVFLVGIPYFFLYYYVFKFMILKFNFKTPGREDAGEVKLASKQEARGKYGLKIQNVGQAEPEKTAPAPEKTEGKELSKQEKTHQQALGLIAAHVVQRISLM